MYELRLPTNYAFGTLSQAAAISDTVLNSADFATDLPSGLSTTTYCPVVLQDPALKIYEIVWATAHTAAATSATVVRGREGTSARAWPSGTLWTVAPTTRDGVLPVANRAGLPSDPGIGLRAELLDEQTIIEWALTGWWSPSRQLAGRILITTGLAHQAISAETNFTKLGIGGGVRTRANWWYDFELLLSMQFSAGNESWMVRVRKDTPVTGTEIASWTVLSRVAGWTETPVLRAPWKATADNTSTALYVSVARSAGAGTCDLNQKPSSFRVVERGGEPGIWTEVA